MAENSSIQWTTHTFNPWRGCTKVSEGCTHCYAETLSKRSPGTLGTWGPRGQRVVAAESYWRQPVRWNAAAQKAGERHRVFCASLADVFEGGESMPFGVYGLVRDARVRLFRLIEATPHLDWLLLTKRPENVMRQVDEVYRECLCQPTRWPLPNVWLGASVEDQRRADERIPHLLRCPAAVRFLSCEPLLGPLQLDSERAEGAHAFGCGGGRTCGCGNERGIDWVIAGGESGPHARPFDLQWARDLRDQCHDAGVPFFLKQLGSQAGISGDHDALLVAMKDRKGGDPAEWPTDLRDCREFPVPVERADR